MQLQGGACAYNLSASCKNSSARSQAKEYPKQLVAISPLCLPFRTVFLLPSEKFTMASRMYVVKRGKPAASEALCARGSFFGGACRHAPTSHVQLLSLCAFFSDTDGRKETVMFDKITSRISKLCYGLNPDFVDPVGFLSG